MSKSREEISAISPESKHAWLKKWAMGVWQNVCEFPQIKAQFDVDVEYSEHMYCYNEYNCIKPSNQKTQEL